MVRKLRSHPFYVVLLLLYTLLIVLPIVYIIIQTFISDSLMLNIQTILNTSTVYLLLKSIFIAFNVALFSTIIGVFLGFSLQKTTIRFKSIFKLIILLPLFVSPYILSVAWKDFIYMLVGNSDAIYSHIGVIWVMITIYSPLSMLIIMGALSNINQQIEDAGLMVASYSNIVFKLILPLIKPALLSSFVLIFIFSISAFSIPAFFGVKVFTTEIFTQFSAFYNHALALLQSSILIIICVGMLLLQGSYISKVPFLSIGVGGNKTELIEQKHPRTWLLLVGWIVVTIMTPLTVLVVQTYEGGIKVLGKAMSLLIPSFSTSLWLALIGALVSIIIGFIVAYYSFKSRGANHINIFDSLLLIVFAVPSTILGISLIKFYNTPSLDFIYSTYTIIIIGYIGKFSFISSKLIGGALRQVPHSLVEVAEMEKISKYSIIRHILMPIIAPSLFIGFIISFIFCLGELGTTIMVYPPGTDILPIKVYTMMANAPQSLASAMTLIVFLFTLSMIIFLYLMYRILIPKYRQAYD